MPCKALAIGTVTCLSLLPATLAAQSAEPCVDFAWAAFRNEVENEINVVEAQGDDYLTAYGLIRSTQTCLQFTKYPDTLAEAATNFREAVDRTEDAIASAILTNTTAMIFGLANSQGGSGIDGVIYFYPDATPGTESSSGTTDLSSTILDGTLMTMQLATPSNQSTNRAYRMLSRDEMRRVQAFLTRRGFDTGGIDGIAGDRTYRAIARFQRAEGLRPTGVLSSEQLERILN